VSGAILSFDDVTKEYSLGDTKAYGVRSVSARFLPGEFTALVGPSGSGKSTLQHLGAGFDKPSSGRVFLMGEDISRYGESRMAKLRNDSIGFIFQTFNLLPVLSAQENVSYPALIRAGGETDRRKTAARAKELLERVGLKDCGRKRPHQLSGGQRQRVAIARALMNSPQLIFADEPTANLDHATGAGILDILESLNANDGVTLVLATHDPEVVRRARRTLRLKDGRIVGDEA
jgi:putative ABC transport system ATP-binding protein